MLAAAAQEAAARQEAEQFLFEREAEDQEKLLQVPFYLFLRETDNFTLKLEICHDARLSANIFLKVSHAFSPEN